MIDIRYLGFGGVAIDRSVEMISRFQFLYLNSYIKVGGCLMIEFDDNNWALYSVVVNAVWLSAADPSSSELNRCHSWRRIAGNTKVELVVVHSTRISTGVEHLAGLPVH